MNKYYVYMYLDLDNIPFYIGKGKDDRHKLWAHLSKNYNNYFLKNKIRKVGVDNIKIYFLYKNLLEEESFKYERYYISVFGRRDLGEGTLCNLTDGGEGNSGRTTSVETKQKLSAIFKGRIVSDETRQKMSAALKGRIFSNAHKQKLSAASKGREHTDKAKQKMSKAHKGKLLSDEHKQRIRDAATGRIVSDEHKQKLSKALKGKPAQNKGKKMSDEVRHNMSVAQKKRREQEKLNKVKES